MKAPSTADIVAATLALVWAAMSLKLGTVTVLRQLVFVGLSHWGDAIAGTELITAAVDAIPETRRFLLPAETGNLLCFGRVCRLKLGLSPGEESTPSGPSVGIGPSNLSAASLAAKKSVSALDHIIDQTSKVPFRPMDPWEISKLLTAYANWDWYAPLALRCGDPTVTLPST
jgi:hypothetical protein